MIKKIKPDKSTYLAHGLWFAESRQLEWGTDLKRNFRRMKVSGQGQGPACPLLKTELRAGIPALSEMSKHHLSLFLYANSIPIFFRPDIERKVRDTNNKRVFFLSRL